MAVRLVQNPFSRDAETLAFNDFGSTLQDLVDSIDMPEVLKKDLVVQRVSDTLDEYETINPDDYSSIFIREDEHYLIMVKMRGSGGGKSIMRMVMMIAVMTFATWAAGIAFGMAGMAASQAGIGLYGPVIGSSAAAGGAAVVAYGAAALTYAGVIGAGMMLTNALIPLPETDVGASTYEASRSLTGSSNQMSMYSPIPKIFGKTRFSPYKVAPDYTEVVGDDTYLRSIMCFGYGPLRISDILIGTNSIDNYQEVEYEIREGWDSDEPIGLYTGGIRSQAYNIKLFGEPSAVITTLDSQEECSFDVNFPYGLFETYSSKNIRTSQTTYIGVKIRKNGETEWVDYNTFVLTYHMEKGFTKTFRVKFPEKGKYDIQISQTGGRHNGTDDFAEGYLTNFRNIAYENPVKIKKGMALLAIRIKATDQLNGTIDNISAICESYHKVPLSQQSDAVEEGDKFRIYKDMDSVGIANSVSEVNYDEIENPRLIIRYLNGITANSNKYNKIDTSIRCEWSSSLGSGNFVKKYTNSSIKDAKEITEYLELPEGSHNDFVLKITHLGDVGHWTETITYYDVFYKDYKARDVSYSEACLASTICSPQLDFISKNKYEPISGKKIILSRHPAWHLYDVLTGSACKEIISDDKIDIDSLLAWEEHYPEWYVDKALDGNFTRLEVIRALCSAGKAFFTQINGKYTVVMDRVGKEPVAAISSRNSFGFEMSKSFQSDLHGFKVSYIEPSEDWTEQEVIVYNNGYNESNATNFESISSYGCTDRTRAWKFGKYMLGQYIQRPETYTVSQDIENLIVNTGDVVILYSDVIKSGIGSARIKQMFINDDDRAEGFILDDKFFLPTGNSYNAFIRSATGELNAVSINPTTEETDLFEFTTPLPLSLMPEKDEQVFLGIVEKSGIRCVVNKKEGGPDFTANITLVAEAPEIHDESTDEMPAYNPNITDIPMYEYPQPLSPAISNIIADERALIQSGNGSYQEAVSFLAQPQKEEKTTITSIQVYVQMKDSATINRFVFPYTGNDNISVTGVEGDRDATIKVRYVSDKNMVSNWSEFDIYVSGKSNPPPDIANLDRQGYNITWNYENKPLDFEGFRVYYNYGVNSNINEAIRGHSESLWSSPPYSTQNLPRGYLTLFVVGVDDSGNESLNPAIISFYNGDIEYDNIIETINLKALGFPGKYESLEILEENLITKSVNKFYQKDTVSFYSGDESNFYREESFDEAVYYFEILNTSEIDNAYIKLDWEISGTYKIYYRRASQSVFYPDKPEVFYPNSSDFFYKQDQFWYPMPDKLLVGQETVTFKIVFESSKNISSVTKLIATIDAPDVSEYVSDLNVGLEGSKIPISKKFKVINKVFLTLIDSPNVSSAKVINYDLDGPLVKAYDFNGNPTEATINADVRGYA